MLDNINSCEASTRTAEPQITCPISEAPKPLSRVGACKRCRKRTKLRVQLGLSPFCHKCNHYVRGAGTLCRHCEHNHNHTTAIPKE